MIRFITLAITHLHILDFGDICLCIGLSKIWGMFLYALSYQFETTDLFSGPF